MEHILRCFNGKSAVGMHRAFGASGCAGCVNDHYRVFGVGHFGGGGEGLICYKIFPPNIAPFLHRDFEAVTFVNEGVLHWRGDAGSSEDNGVFYGGGFFQRFIRGWFHGDDFAAPVRAVAGEEKFGVGVG